jgi:HAD superfamily hydrolase (TIGR01549 family)
VKILWRQYLLHCWPPVYRKIQNAVLVSRWHTGFEDLVTQLNIPLDIVEAMRKVYLKIEIPKDSKIKCYGDESCIRALPVKKYLVTTGYRKFQQAKIDRTKISSLFDEIIIDEMENPETRKGKKKIFQDILELNNWDKAEVMVVGDNPKSELGIAKSLGIATVQTLRLGVEKYSEANYYIISLCELAGIVAQHH